MRLLSFAALFSSWAFEACSTSHAASYSMKPFRPPTFRVPRPAQCIDEPPTKKRRIEEDADTSLTSPLVASPPVVKSDITSAVRVTLAAHAQTTDLTSPKSTYYRVLWFVSPSSCLDSLSSDDISGERSLTRNTKHGTVMVIWL